MEAACQILRLTVVLVGVSLSDCPLRAPPHAIDGWWSQYSPEATAAVEAYRGWSREGLDGFIAVPDCRRVGQFAAIWVNGRGPYRTRVFDCLGRDGDPAYWERNRVLGELDYSLAAANGVVGKGGVEAQLVWLSGR